MMARNEAENPTEEIVAASDEREHAMYERFLGIDDDLEKRLYLMGVCREGPHLFYRGMARHLTEYMPIVYAPTVARSIMEYDRHYTSSDVAYVSIDHPELIKDALRKYAGDRRIELIVATDGEGILGIGDWGAQGAEILTGKLAVYTAAAGIDPSHVLPVMIDAGTNRTELLDNPRYVGNRFPRVRGERYDRFIDTFVHDCLGLYPHALLHWEDFGRPTAAPILERYRHDLLTLNDDIQGTGVTVLAALVSARRIAGTSPADTRILVFGAGTAGVGIADQLVDDLIARGGLGRDEAVARVALVDRYGLVYDDQDGLTDGQRRYARRRGEFPGLDDPTDLADVVEAFRPTVLIGTSTRAGAFDERVVRAMARHTDRPLICPISNPTELAEAKAADVIRWSEGRALVITGTPSAPVEYDGVTHRIGQGNNALMYPGICFGAIVGKARRISDGMLLAAAYAISDMIDTDDPGAAVLPPVSELPEISRRVAVAVARQAVVEGLNREPVPDVEAAVEANIWRP
ncbi:NAD-dependent malic enzyme [Bifidobacterium simiarum]|uniref:NAD-dependent malic enzyme n=1 Tax=Bifidobacterium simiarum TaxID=2045441 RepID=A0A2M9HE78_9BIFI|nr:NAD-dependent malic enzyme [Bifidobacterium simiarum]MBT1167140.1 NAD-dependent malic enzyme [Bifidobacterium simiarum]PJM75112.1 NAD-dependent malic enzyme [Bifidobacterium simiarum]